jgi:hypothetical protein
MALLTLACSSCGKISRRPVHPVQGRVFFQGKPAAEAIVYFHPLDAHDPKEEYYQPTGIVQPDGAFRLTTYETDEGAPAGEYSVTVVWRRPGVGSDDAASSMLPERYESPVTSGLRARILEGPTQLEPFQLTNAAVNVYGGREREGR